MTIRFQTKEMTYSEFHNSEITCDCCHTVLKEIFRKTVLKNNKPVTVKRLKCESCENVITVYGSGFRDLILLPEEAVKAVINVFRQESNARR